MMNILAVSRTSHFHGIGGFEDHIRTLYSGLVAKGHRVTLLTTGHPEGLSHTEFQGVQVRFLPCKPGRYSKEWWKLSAKETATFLSKHPVDIFHSQSYSGSEVFKQQILKLHNTPSAVSFHGTSYDEYKTKNNLTQFEWKPLIPYVDYIRNYLEWRSHVRKFDHYCLTHADCVIATSTEQQHIFESVYDVPTKKITCIFNGMNIEQFTPQEKPKDMILRYKLNGAFIVGCLARLEPDKGVQYVLREFPSVLQMIPSAILVIVGSGSYEHHLKKLAKTYGIEDSVIFVGKIPFEEVNKALTLFDVFVNLTIRQNGYDLTMVEAMACERPVIASAIGSHPTLITHGHTGFLIPISQFSNLKTILFSLHTDDTLRNTIEKNSRKTILEAFTDKTMVFQTDMCFKRLIDAKR